VREDQRPSEFAHRRHGYQAEQGERQLGYSLELPKFEIITNASPTRHQERQHDHRSSSHLGSLQQLHWRSQPKTTCECSHPEAQPCRLRRSRDQQVDLPSALKSPASVSTGAPTVKLSKVNAPLTISILTC